MNINKIQTNFNNHTYEYSTFEILNKDHVPIVLRRESYEYCTIIPIFFSVLNVKIHNLRVQVQAVQTVIVNKFVQYVHFMCLCFEL